MSLNNESLNFCVGLKLLQVTNDRFKKNTPAYTDVQNVSVFITKALGKLMNINGVCFMIFNDKQPVTGKTV